MAVDSRTRSASEVLAAVYDSTNGVLRTSASVVGDVVVDKVKITDGVDNLLVNADGSINTVITGNVALDITAAGGDSIAISDGTDTLQVNADGSVNVVVSNNLLTDAQLRATPIPVSGTVAVSNLPATQPVSAASLPLPTGAASEATLAALNTKVTAVNTGAVTISSALPAGANAIGSVSVSNFPATQPISAAALPLPAGAATSAKQDDEISWLTSIESALAEAGGEALLTTRVDEASSTVTYVGKSYAGTSPATALWRISRITVTGTVTVIEYADGNTNLDNIWNNRAALSYS